MGVTDQHFPDPLLLNRNNVATPSVELVADTRSGNRSIQTQWSSLLKEAKIRQLREDMERLRGQARVGGRYID
jgi:hypothetical protein